MKTIKYSTTKIWSYTVVVLPKVINIVDVERFAGLNVRSFNPTEVFGEILSHYLGQKYFSRGAYIHGKNFTVLLKTVKVYLSKSFHAYGK